MDDLELIVVGVDDRESLRRVSACIRDVEGVVTLLVDVRTGRVCIGGTATRDAVCRAILEAGFRTEP
ncbi:hypothetical protein [Euzebya rosea]|uniref:hypothetical protein n=1 Tax=Euzebya rosea TaxID=2052804 RepID=UPI000D3E1EAC|nr:hypothetical protein [Euzebya rosea]